MDNVLQIEEIKKYRRYIRDTTGKEIDEETAAKQWISIFARSWRTRHAGFNECGD